MKFTKYMFNFPHEATKQILLYNAFSGALALIESEKWETVKYWQLHGIDNSDPDLISDLQRGSFIHADSVDELQELKLRLFSGRFSSNGFGITIAPTSNCNFRCPYCYEDHHAVSMTRDTLDRIEEYITAQAPRYKQVILAWFGGEPTLCKDTVLEVSNIVQNLQKQYGFHYAANMTTNGYLLNDKLFRQFYQAGITSYQITIDGWNHDKTRPHVSGKGTLQTIINNLASLSKLPPTEYSFHITLRHNILADDEDYSWYDYLYRLFGHDKRFAVLVRAVGDWGGEGVHSLSILHQDTKDVLVAKHVAYLDKIGMSCHNHRNGALAQVCYASYPHSMVFRANGKIGKCTVALDHPQNQLGWVDPEKGIVIDPEVNCRWSFSDLKPECRSCRNVLRCMNMQCKKSEIIDGKTVCLHRKSECV